MGLENEISAGEQISSRSIVVTNDLAEMVNSSAYSIYYNNNTENETSDTVKPKNSLPEEANSILYYRDCIIGAVVRDGRKVKTCGKILPDIRDVNIFGTAVVMYFADGTMQKAKLCGDDEFSLEQGISICLTKRLLDDKTYSYGHEIYNKLVNHAMKVYQNNRRWERELEDKTALESARIEKKIAKLKAKKEKRLAAKREADKERQIEIQKEAYLRAMRELAKEKN